MEPENMVEIVRESQNNWKIRRNKEKYLKKEEGSRRETIREDS